MPHFTADNLRSAGIRVADAPPSMAALNAQQNAAADLAADLATGKRRPRNTAKANLGKSLEIVVLASQGNLVRLEKMPTSGFYRREGNRTVFTPGLSPVDFVGVVISSGRAIEFDVKQCDQAVSFPLRRVRPHQVGWVVRQGSASAIAGVLIEATHPAQAAYFWLDWNVLGVLIQQGIKSIRWNDGGLIKLGDNRHSIDFARIPGVK